MKQAIESDSCLALFKYYEMVWARCGVRCLPGSLARQMRPVPPLSASEARFLCLVSVSAIWLPVLSRDTGAC